MNKRTIQSGLVAEAILNGLEKQKFADWYDDKFERYLYNDEEAPSKEEILKDIGNIFRISSIDL